MRSQGVWERDRFLSVLRARHIERSLRQVSVPYVEHTFAGDWNEGVYVEHDGSGNHILVAWDSQGVVALAFDHDSDNEHALPLEERDPAQHLEGLPPELEPLAAKACAIKPRLATSAEWATRSPRPARSVPELLDGFERLPEEVYGVPPTPQLLEAAAKMGFKIAKPDRELLVLALAKASAAGSYTITEADDQVLAMETARPMDAAGAAAAIKQLSAVGISWPAAEKRVAEAT